MCCVSFCVCVGNIQQGRSGTKVPRPDIYRSIILSEITNQMWHFLWHPFSQRNKTSKNSRGVKEGSDGKRGWAKFKRGGVGNIGGSS